MLKNYFSQRQYFTTLNSSLCIIFPKLKSMELVRKSSPQCIKDTDMWALMGSTSFVTLGVVANDFVSYKKNHKRNSWFSSFWWTVNCMYLAQKSSPTTLKCIHLCAIMRFTCLKWHVMLAKYFIWCQNFETLNSNHCNFFLPAGVCSLFAIYQHKGTFFNAIYTLVCYYTNIILEYTMPHIFTTVNDLNFSIYRHVTSVSCKPAPLAAHTVGAYSIY